MKQAISHREKVSATGEITPVASFPAMALPAQKRVASVSSVYGFARMAVCGRRGSGGQGSGGKTASTRRAAGLCFGP